MKIEYIGYEYEERDGNDKKRFTAWVRLSDGEDPVDAAKLAMNAVHKSVPLSANVSEFVVGERVEKKLRELADQVSKDNLPF